MKKVIVGGILALVAALSKLGDERHGDPGPCDDRFAATYPTATLNVRMLRNHRLRHRLTPPSRRRGARAPRAPDAPQQLLQGHSPRASASLLNNPS